MIEAWKFVVTRYQNYPLVVAADLVNEPYFNASAGQNGNVTCTGPNGVVRTLTGPLGDMAHFYERAGQAVQTIKPNLLVIYEDTNLRTNADGTCDTLHPFGLTRKPNLTNAVYSYHLYRPGWAPPGAGVCTGRDTVQTYYNRAVPWNVPLYQGEFDAFKYGSNLAFLNGACTSWPPVDSCFDPNWQSDTATMFSFLRTYNISWNYFSYVGANQIWDPNYAGPPDPGRRPKPNLVTTLQGGF
jgi:hypothetical protein